jgi:restriction system protein
MFNKDRIEKIKKKIRILYDSKIIDDSVWKNYEEFFEEFDWNWISRIGYFQSVRVVKGLENVKKENEDILDLEYVLFDAKFAKHEWKKIGESYESKYPDIIQEYNKIKTYANERASTYDNTKKEIVKNMIKTLACYGNVWDKFNQKHMTEGTKQRKFLENLIIVMYGSEIRPDDSEVSKILKKHKGLDGESLETRQELARHYNKKEQTQSTNVISENDLQDGFSKFDWRQMEELTGKLFEKKGYEVEVTQGSGDYGIDVWAKKDGMTLGIQVKKWRNDVGFEDVAKTLGSNMSKANKYILISTTSFFTPQAWKHQKQHSTIIELWDTNKFRQELRENFVDSSNYNQQSTHPSDTLHSTSYNKDSNIDEVYNSHNQNKTNSFDYDKGFNIDEVYNSSSDSTIPIHQKCVGCGKLVSGNVCHECGTVMKP